MIRRQLRAQQRELEAEGTTVEAWLHAHRMATPRSESGRARLGLSPRGYVAFWPDRPGQPLASVVYHKDRHCQYLRDMGWWCAQQLAPPVRWRSSPPAEEQVTAAREPARRRVPNHVPNSAILSESNPR